MLMQIGLVDEGNFEEALKNAWDRAYRQFPSFPPPCGEGQGGGLLEHQ